MVEPTTSNPPLLFDDTVDQAMMHLCSEASVDAKHMLRITGGIRQYIKPNVSAVPYCIQPDIFDKLLHTLHADDSWVEPMALKSFRILYYGEGHYNLSHLKTNPSNRFDKRSIFQSFDVTHTRTPVHVRAQNNLYFPGAALLVIEQTPTTLHMGIMPTWCALIWEMSFVMKHPVLGKVVFRMRKVFENSTEELCRLSVQTHPVHQLFIDFEDVERIQRNDSVLVTANMKQIMTNIFNWNMCPRITLDPFDDTLPKAKIAPSPLPITLPVTIPATLPIATATLVLAPGEDERPSTPTKTNHSNAKKRKVSA